MPETNGLPNLGAAGVIVGGCFFLVRYFMAQLDKKDQRLTDLFERFIQVTEANTNALVELRRAIER